MSKIDDAIDVIDERMMSIESEQDSLNRQVSISQAKLLALSTDWLAWNVVKKILTRDEAKEKKQ